ncbi:MAG: M23 family metallopeptidase [Spirochaetia bacterium]|nr:M23 family metallopeptidase [Spirochaetia bacterium]
MKKKRKLFLFFFTVIFSFYVFAVYGEKEVKSLQNISLQWPVPKDKIKKISSTFAESRLDHFHAGIDIVGENLPVLPVEKGRLLWKKNPVRKKGEIPFGGGITVVLDHGSFWSGYMHLKKISEKIENEINGATILKKEDIIGFSGDTGHSGGAHLHYFIYDQKKRKIYNPLALMPAGIYKNKTAPKIEKFAVLLPENLAEVDLKKEIVMSQDFPVYAQIKDSAEKHERWGVYSLKVYSKKNAQPDVDIVFDHIEFKNNKWRTSNGKAFEDVYYMNWYLLGKNFKRTRFLSLETAGYNAPEKIETIDMKIRDQ